eukprot:1180959-Prorocentrum_minimum.AAC.3
MRMTITIDNESDSAFLDVARPRSDARPDFRSERSEASSLLRGDPPAGGPGKEAAQRQGTKDPCHDVSLDLGLH